MGIYSPLPTAHCPLRRGTTLTEVLISMMIMSIGLISLASLFPIAIIRAVQANQLTQSTNLRYNAEAMIDIYPHLLDDPDPGDWDNDGNFYNDPRDSSSIQVGNFPGLPYNRRSYIVDPLGWALIDDTTLRDAFGNINGAAVNNSNGFPFLVRYNGGFRNTSNLPDSLSDPTPAHSVVSLPDNWNIMVDETPASLTQASGRVTGVTFEPQVALDAVRATLVMREGQISLNGLSSLAVRGVFFDGTGKRSQVRALTASSQITLATGGAGGSITWVPAQTALPAGFVPERVRIETREPKFTWFLTVRKSPGFGRLPSPANVDVVCCFDRSFAAADERVYTASSSVLSAKSRNFGFERNPQQPESPYTVYMSYNTANQDEKPLVKKGGFILDAENGHWYRIRNFDDANGNMTIFIDRPAVENSNRAIFMPGVVDVFPLGVK